MSEASPGRPSNSLHFIVGEMSGKLDQVLATLLIDREEVKDMQGRLTKVERWQMRMIGGGSVIVFLITAVEGLQHYVRR